MLTSPLNFFLLFECKPVATPLPAMDPKSEILGPLLDPIMILSPLLMLLLSSSKR